MGVELELLKRIEDLERLMYRQPEVGGVWQDWTPTITWNGTAPTTLTADSSFRYTSIGRVAIVNGYGIYTNAGSSNTLVTVTLPIAPLSTILAQTAHAAVTNSVTQNLTRAHIRNSTNDIYITCASVSANRLLFMAMYEF